MTENDLVQRLLDSGYVRRYVVVAGKKHGRQRFVIAFAHPTKRIAIEVGRSRSASRDENLRRIGWTVLRFDGSEESMEIRPKIGRPYGSRAGVRKAGNR